jgi:hypothetical protein
VTAGNELTVDFNERYFGSGNSAGGGQLPPSAVGIDAHRYLLDTESREYKRTGIDVVQQRNTTNQRDVLLLPQDVWRQQSESWHLGAGQRNLDREDALQNRFYRSFGIDPWSKYELSLLNETALLEPLGDHPTFLYQHKSQLVIAHGQEIRLRSDTAGAGSVIAVGSTVITSAAYDGENLWTLHEDGEINQTNLDTSTVTSKSAAAGDATGATFIAYTKDYLIVGVGNVLYDVTVLFDASPVWPTQPIYTSPVAGFTWKGACDGHSGIYLIGGSGDRHIIHRVGIKTDGTGLDPAVVAGQLPDGENGTAIGSYLGFVFVGSELGIRMANPSSTSGDLTLGALIETRAPVLGFEGQDRFVWATGSSVNSQPDVQPAAIVCGLYRVDLSTFTVSESTPAYATDIFTPLETGKIVDSVTTWGDIRVFSVRDGGVYYETENKVPDGWIEQGRVSYSVEDTKTALYAQAKWRDPLAGVVAIDLSYDNAAPMRVMNWAVQGTVRSGNIALGGRQFSRVDARYTLYRDEADPTLGPVFTRFEIRARPVRGRASRWVLPLINHEQLDLNGVIEARNTTTEFEFLLEVCQSGRMVALQEWGKTYQVVAKDYEWRPEKLTSIGAGWQGVFVIVLEEVR